MRPFRPLLIGLITLVGIALSGCASAHPGVAVAASFQDESDALSRALPIRARASAAYVGQHLPQGEIIRLSDRDRDVQPVRAAC